MPEDEMYTVYRVYYETKSGAKHERNFRSAESRDIFMNGIRAEGGKITGTSRHQERKQEPGFNLMR